MQKNDTSRLYRLFVDFTPDRCSQYETICFYSDASLNKHFGMGAIYKDDWMQELWDPQFIVEKKPSIEFLELFTLTAAVVTWGASKRELNKTRIEIFCDNEAVIQMVNNSASSCKQCRKLIRILTIEGIKFNRRLWVR